MSKGFRSCRRQGQHFDRAKRAVELLRTTVMAAGEKQERRLENALIARLASDPLLASNLRSQLSDQPNERVHQSPLLGFSHRPDASLEEEGTAIEIKVVRTAPDIREAIGQAIAYRVHYRFAVLVLVDRSPGHKLLRSLEDPDSAGCTLLSALADQGVFTVVGPRRAKGRKTLNKFDHVVFPEKWI